MSPAFLWLEPGKAREVAALGLAALGLPACARRQGHAGRVRASGPSPQVLEMFTLVLRQCHKESEDKWKRLSRQVADVILPMLARQQVRLPPPARGCRQQVPARSATRERAGRCPHSVSCLLCSPHSLSS